MARKARIKTLVYTFHPQGIDGPAVFDEFPGFTTDEQLLKMYESEVERHVVLYFAEQAAQAVPGHPSAYLVEAQGLSRSPWRKRTNIPVQALAVKLRTASEVITYQVHSIRTARGRLLRNSGASRQVNEVQADAILTLSDEAAA